MLSLCVENGLVLSLTRKEEFRRVTMNDSLVLSFSSAAPNVDRVGISLLSGDVGKLFVFRLLTVL